MDEWDWLPNYHKYAVMYWDNWQNYTYTSCKFFANQQEAVNYFPYGSALVVCTFKIKWLSE